MKKVIVTIPKTNGDKWKVSMFGSTGKHRANANTLLGLVKKEFLAKNTLSSCLELDEKTSISIKEHTDSGVTVVNESVSSTQPHYLLYCLACFLEDYLPEKTINKYVT